MLHLDKWQEDALAHKGDLILCTGRQIGKTTIMAIKAAERMVSQKNCSIIVCSLTEDQAQLIIIMVLKYLEQKYKQWIAEPYSKNITKNKIALNNGSSILARPVGNTGDAVRGFTGNVLILDEASRFNEYIFTAGEPTLLSTGGEVWMCSTPFGKEGYFYEQYNSVVNEDDSDKENEMGWKVIHVDGEKALQDREISESWTKEKRELSLRRLERIKKRWSALRYGQEILAKFMDDLQRLCSPAWISKVCILEGVGRRDHIPHFLGLDIARMGKDLCSYEIIDRISQNNLQHVFSETTSKQYTTETFDRILRLNDTWNFKKIGIDAGSGSLGVGLMDFLMREGKVCKKIEALNNRRIVLDKYNETSRGLLKEDMYDLMISLGENGTLKLLKDPKVIASLESVQIEFVEKEGKRTMIKIWGRDTHIAEGIIRAVWLANQKSLNLSISYI